MIKKIENKQFKLLPPHPEKCQECATEHDPELPHNKMSLFYQVKFNLDHQRSATWIDAMAHCSEEIKKHSTEALTELGLMNG